MRKDKVTVIQEIWLPFEGREILSGFLEGSS